MDYPSRKNLLTVAIVLLAFATSAAASTYKVIFTFQGGTDANFPKGAMIADASGNLYGTTEFGGTHGLGTVFKLTNSAGVWSESVLYSFSGGTDGGQPGARLVMDAAGNLYGTAEGGGDPTCIQLHGFCGVVFELSPNQNGTWTESVLHTFEGPDGNEPLGGLIFDGNGNLYGTTFFGGSAGWGTVFELSPNGDGTWTQTILHDFALDANGAKPDSDLVFDAGGNLYGTTNIGGILNACLTGFGCGTVFKLAPSGGTWTESVLLRFRGTDGDAPTGVTFDPFGHLFGVTPDGGSGPCTGLIINGCGGVFELSSTASGLFQHKIVRQFQSTPVAAPDNVVTDAAGNIFGASLFGGLKNCSNGAEQCGTIYELSPKSSGGFSLSVLYEFTGQADGFWPYAALTIDRSGNIYGTTGNGGNLKCGISGGCGVVFQIIP